MIIIYKLRLLGYNLVEKIYINHLQSIYESSYNDFTLNFGNNDLIINNQTGTCNQTNYESNILNSNTSLIEEMEIFSFTKVE